MEAYLNGARSFIRDRGTCRTLSRLKAYPTLSDAELLALDQKLNHANHRVPALGEERR